MKWTTATALLLVLSAGGVGAAFVLTRTPATPSETLAEIRGQMESAAFDHAAALRRLDRALDSGRTLKDPTVAVELLKTRSDIYRDLGNFDLAKADIVTLLATHRRGDRALELELARLESLNGQLAGALRRSRGLLGREPDFAAAWELRGELEETAAMRVLTPAFELIDFSLPREDAAVAKALLTELAARDRDDPTTSSLRFQLGEIFVASDEADLYDALAALAEPRESFANAREAYSRAISLEPTASRVVGLARMLETAGQLEHAITLQQAAQTLDAVALDADALASLLEDLAHAGRVSEARASLLAWSWETGGTLEFFRSAGEFMYRDGDFSVMKPIADGLKNLGGQIGQGWSWFYGNLRVIRAASNSSDPSRMANQLRTATERLREFAQNENYSEPFYGAKADAWFWIAEGYQSLGEFDRERYALNKGLAIRPDHSSQAWVRLAATLKARTPVPWTQVELALTEALELGPERTAELLPDWLEAGRATLINKGITFDELVDEIARDQTAVPTLRKVGPAVLTLLAQDHLANGRGFSALQAAKRALRDHPRIIPPLDVIIGAKLLQPNRFDVERDIVARIEAAGIDESVEAFLEQLPAGRLEGEALVRAIRAAPVRFGKPAVARWYREHGDPVRAGEALAGLDPTKSPPSLRLLRAQTLVDEARYEDAIEQLDMISGSDRLAQEAVLVRAAALIGAGNPEDLDALVRQLDGMHAGTDLLLEMADLLMSNGRADLALAIVDRLDVTPATRTPEFYRRRILVDILLAGTRGPEPALESILRSEAYLRDGTPELASILFAVARRQWTELPDLVARLRASSFEISPEQDVALTLLEERLEAGQRAANAGLERAPRDPAWALLSAAAASLVDAEIELPEWFGPTAASDAQRLLRGKDRRTARDPRETLVIFILSDLPGWSPWLLPLMNRVGRTTSSAIWVNWLMTRIHSARGDEERLRATVTRLVDRQRGFGPGHDMAVRIAEERFPTEPLHPNVVRARKRRSDSLGPELIDNPVEIALAEAGSLARENKITEAAQTLQAVLADAGEAETEARLILGLLMIRAKQPSFAATYLFDAAMADAGIFETVVLDSLRLSLRFAILSDESGTPQRGALGKERALEMLDALAVRYPLDPMIALARLESMDIADGERGARARVILEQLYARSGRRSLEELRLGSTRPWVELLAPIAADVAYDLVQRDLTQEPGSLELWQLSGLAAEAIGNTDEARRAYETLLSMDPRSDTGYALATLLVDQGTPKAELESVLRAADRAQGGGSRRSTFIRALAEMRRPKLNAGQVIDRLDSLWQARDRARREIDPFEVGVLYADALFRRHNPEDLAALEQVLADLEPLAAADSYSSGFVAALQGLHRALAAQAPRPE